MSHCSGQGKHQALQIILTPFGVLHSPVSSIPQMVAYREEPCGTLLHPS